MESPANEGRGDCLNNLYQVMTRMGGLYAQALALAPSKYAEDWDQTTDVLLADIGHVCRIWEEYLTAEVEEVPSECPLLSRAVDTLNERVIALIPLLGTWHESRRWIQVIGRCEQRLFDVLTRFGDAYPGAGPEFDRLIANSGQRLEKLDALAGEIATEAERAQREFETNAGLKVV